MAATHAVSTSSACPLCGAAGATSSGDRKRQLRMQLRSLETGNLHVKHLSRQLTSMCAACRLLMIGINSDDDRLELQERIAMELEPIAMTAPQHTAVPGEAGAGAKPDGEHLGSRRDPEERPACCAEETREKMLDKTLADSFPTSDPPSSIPDPAADDSLAA